MVDCRSGLRGAHRPVSLGMCTAIRCLCRCTPSWCLVLRVSGMSGIAFHVHRIPLIATCKQKNMCVSCVLLQCSVIAGGRSSGPVEEQTPASGVVRMHVEVLSSHMRHVPCCYVPSRCPTLRVRVPPLFNHPCWVPRVVWHAPTSVHRPS